MLRKKVISIIVACSLILGTASPTLAQDNSTENTSGVLANFIQLLQKMLNQNKTTQPNPGFTNQNNNPVLRNDEASKGGQIRPGELNTSNLTNAQKQAIITEIQKVKDEVQAWSVSTGLNAGYIFRGLLPPGMNPGMNQNRRPDEQGGSDENGGQGQTGGPNGQSGMMRQGSPGQAGQRPY